MTESYDPCQNTVAERINEVLKHELLINTNKLNTNLMTKIVENSIIIYNRKRPHWSCHMKTPEQMHKENHRKRKSQNKLWFVLGFSNFNPNKNCNGYLGLVSFFKDYPKATLLKVLIATSP